MSIVSIEAQHTGLASLFGLRWTKERTSVALARSGSAVHRLVMATTTDLRGMTNEAIVDTYAKLKRARDSMAQKLQSQKKRESEMLDRVVNTTSSMAGSAGAAFIDGRWGPNMEVGGLPVLLMVGTASTVAGLGGVGGKWSDTLASFGTGVLNWELGKVIYNRTAQSQQASVSGALPRSQQSYAPQAMPAYTPQPAAMGYAPPASAYYPRAATVADVQRQWATVLNGLYGR